MTKILANKWFVAVIGAVAFGLTTTLMVLFKKPVEQSPTSAAQSQNTNAAPSGTNAAAQGTAGVKQTAPEPAPSEEPTKTIASAPSPAAAFTGAIGEPGTHTFNNPDIISLVNELRREKSALLAKAAALDELKHRLDAEKAEIGAITQEVLNAKASMMRELTNQMNIRDKGEETRLQALARVYTNMPPAAAVKILDGMDVEDVAKLLVLMDFKDQAAILENFATNELTKAAGKATEISQKMRKLAEKPKLATPK